MSNFIYGKAKEAFLNGLIDMSNDQIDIIFTKSTYIPSQSSDEFVSDLDVSNITTTPIGLSNVTNTLGIIDANDVLVSDYPGTAFNAVVIFQSNTSAQDSRLIAYIDTSEGLPFSGTNDTIDITISWSNGPNKIISI
jgi:hypothetical protein